jgi:lipoprotein-releasing system ATP-binding protein
MTESIVLEAQHLQKIYFEGPQEVQVLRDVNLSVQKGERLAIVGSSGSGKSTLLNLLGGLDTPTKGSVKVAGKELTTLDQNERGKLRNQYLGFVYQFHHLLGEFTALENVSMPLLIARQSSNRAKAQASELLQRVGLGKRLDHKPSELSGGERQRVAIARAMVTQPACVLMDEPTGNLDQNTAKSIEALIQELNQELGLSFIIVSHDLTLAHSMDRVLELQQGSLHEVFDKTTGLERNGSHQ